MVKVERLHKIILNLNVVLCSVRFEILRFIHIYIFYSRIENCMQGKIYIVHNNCHKGIRALKLLNYSPREPSHMEPFKEYARQKANM